MLRSTRRRFIGLSGVSIFALAGCSNVSSGPQENNRPSPEDSPIEDEDKAEKLVSEYGLGLREMDHAREIFGRGQDEIDSEKFSVAVESFSSAGGRVGDARDHFSESIRLARVIDNPTAEKESETADTFGMHVGAACMHNSVAAELLKDGYNDAATNELNSGRAQLGLATDIDVATPEYMAELVGISD